MQAIQNLKQYLQNRVDEYNRRNNPIAGGYNDVLRSVERDGVETFVITADGTVENVFFDYADAHKAFNAMRERQVEIIEKKKNKSVWYVDTIALYNDEWVFEVSKNDEVRRNFVMKRVVAK